MHNDIAIRVTRLSKKYSIGKKDGTLRLIDGIANIFRKGKHHENGLNEFYALKDVSFEVKKGEAVGIIGPNGAGKSTLLKILSRVTEPTEGKVEIYGTVASVLEVGMGFHPELTGRENVYLSGIMMGIPKKKIAEKFDEIVEFAGVEKFIDTPVKHYSSGMYVRLAFSVVANIDADILLFDEVLSVGDLAFQMKCSRKIKELIEQKKTVLLVSHNMNDIFSICIKAILLIDGKIFKIGHLDVINKYYDSVEEFISPSVPKKNNNTYLKEWLNEESPGDKNIKIRKFYIVNETRKCNFDFYTTDCISINFEFEIITNTVNYDIGVIFSNFNSQVLIAHLKNSSIDKQFFNKTGYRKLKVIIPENLFSDTIIHVGMIVLNSRDFIYYSPEIFTIKFKLTEEKSKYYSVFPKTTAPLLPAFHWEEFF